MLPEKATLLSSWHHEQAWSPTISAPVGGFAKRQAAEKKKNPVKKAEALPHEPFLRGGIGNFSLLVRAWLLINIAISPTSG
jgi:hypothetical protein